MKKIIRRLGLYLASLVIGGGLILLVLPILSQDLLTAHVPADDDYFANAYFYHAVLVGEAAAVAALTGFFMHGNKRLRRATLTMPIWVPMTYAVLYLALSYQ